MKKRDIVLTFIGCSIGMSLASKLTKHLPWFKKREAQKQEFEKQIDEQINDLVRACFPTPNFDVHLEDVHLDEVPITEEDKILHNLEEVDKFFLD